MERLKLLFWSETFYPTIGGTEISLYRQIKEILQSGNEVILISPDKNKESFSIDPTFRTY